MNEIRVYKPSQAPRAALELAWETFFASRQRGLSLEAHFPWLAGGGRNDRIFCLMADGQPAATLAMREGAIAHERATYPFCAIGLVCTALPYKRRGFASALLSAAIEAAGEMPVLLWTSQQAFYSRLGFELVDQTVIAACSFAKKGEVKQPQIQQWLPGTESSQLFGGPRGLPPFVTGVVRVRPPASSEVSLLMSDNSAPAVLEMEGSVEAVAQALAALRLNRLTLNLPRPSPLLPALEKLGAKLEIRKTNIAMWRRAGYPACELEQWNIPLLDRF